MRNYYGPNSALDKIAHLTFYHARFQTDLINGSSIWGPVLSSTDLNRIYKIHKKVLDVATDVIHYCLMLKRLPDLTSVVQWMLTFTS